MTSRPFDDLNSSIGDKVLVKLKGDKSIRGVLKTFDVHLNLVLEEAEELENNETKTKFGKIMIRGDSVISIVL